MRHKGTVYVSTAAGVSLSRRAGFGQLLAVLALIFCAAAPPAKAGPAEDFAATLDGHTRQAFEDYIGAQTAYDFAADSYWNQVAEKRAARRARRARGEASGPRDYVMSFPPDYTGPQLAPSLARAYAKYRSTLTSRAPVEPEKPIPTLAEAVETAKQQYGFSPTRIPEREFKRRYAVEALKLGLTKDQVVRIYALETGGQGTADMQAGINPVTRKGREISTALGYAQLLNANSVEETAQHGAGFLARLESLKVRARAEPAGSNAAQSAAARSAELNAKIRALRAMVRAARSVPDKWEHHIAFASTPQGLGIHALNLDGDIGPWLQVVKLRGLKDYADKAGRPQLKGAEIELMNLAGPGTGIEMMAPAGLSVPTPNFFARAAYGRNSIVRGKTAAELLGALDKRMDENLAKPGAVEFAEVFDEIQRRAER